MKPDDLNTITHKVQPAIRFGQQHMVILVIVIFGALYAFMLIEINSLARQEPSDAAINKELSSVDRPKIDEEAVQIIESLQDQNITTEATINENRDNPFSE